MLGAFLGFSKDLVRVEKPKGGAERNAGGHNQRPFEFGAQQMMHDHAKGQPVQQYPDHHTVGRATVVMLRQRQGRAIEHTVRDTDSLVRGAHGVAEGLPDRFAGQRLPKFRPDGGLIIVFAGGEAGLFSAIMNGWVNGNTGSRPITREIIS